jgi:hypothetical protein
MQHQRDETSDVETAAMSRRTRSHSAAARSTDAADVEMDTSAAASNDQEQTNDIAQVSRTSERKRKPAPAEAEQPAAAMVRSSPAKKRVKATRAAKKQLVRSESEEDETSDAEENEPDDDDDDDAAASEEEDEETESDSDWEDQPKSNKARSATKRKTATRRSSTAKSVSARKKYKSSGWMDALAAIVHPKRFAEALIEHFEFIPVEKCDVNEVGAATGRTFAMVWATWNSHTHRHSAAWHPFLPKRKLLQRKIKAEADLTCTDNNGDSILGVLLSRTPHHHRITGNRSFFLYVLRQSVAAGVDWKATPADGHSPLENFAYLVHQDTINNSVLRDVLRCRAILQHLDFAAVVDEAGHTLLHLMLSPPNRTPHYGYHRAMMVLAELAKPANLTVVKRLPLLTLNAANITPLDTLEELRDEDPYGCGESLDLAMQKLNHAWMTENRPIFMQRLSQHLISDVAAVLFEYLAGDWNSSQEKQLKQQLLEAERAAEAVAPAEEEEEGKTGEVDAEEKKEDAPTPMELDAAPDGVSDSI